MPQERKIPHSIRCLKAIEAFNGGREALAERLGISPAAIARWVHEGQIARSSIINLVALSDGRFTAEELLGANDASER